MALGGWLELELGGLMATLLRFLLLPGIIFAVLKWHHRLLWIVRCRESIEVGAESRLLYLLLRRCCSTKCSGSISLALRHEASVAVICSKLLLLRWICGYDWLIIFDRTLTESRIDLKMRLLLLLELSKVGVADRKTHIIIAAYRLRLLLLQKILIVRGSCKAGR